MSRRTDQILDKLQSLYGENLRYLMDGDDPIMVDLAGAGITTFDPDLLQLKSLTDLDLSANALKSIPIDRFNYPALEQLRLWANRIARLPANMGHMPRLAVLNLGNNRLTALSASVVQCKNLQVLDLRQNQLRTLPEELGYLPYLTELDLTGNHLVHLPVSLGSSHLQQLFLDGNPLAEPLPELAERGVDAVLAYLRSIANAEPQYEGRLLLLGEGNVGKSCLVDALAGLPFIPNRPTTHGIQIGSLKLPHPDATIAAPIVLNTWDFGGQELYRVTHQFFYSRRSLYLLVWHPREGAEQNDIEGWLERVRVRVTARDARVFLVSTHADDDRRPDLDVPGLKARYGQMIRGVFEIDSRTGKGIDKLKQALATEAAMLPQMGSLLNPSWVAARDEISALPETHITKHKFMQLCKKRKLDRAASLTLADLMHDLGRVVHYADYQGLQDLIVLKPEWLTRAISFVLEDRQTADRSGVLDHDRLSILWSDSKRASTDRYPKELHPYFLRLMEQFDISYRFEDGTKSIVAQMVPFERPKGIHEGIAGRRLSLIYELESDAPGLIPWLIVRTHRFTMNKHWRRGMVLEHQAHKAIIQLDTRGRRLDLSVHGRSPSYLFHILMDTIAQVLSRWPGLDYERFIPCGSEACIESPTPGRFRLSTLERARDHGRTQYPCDRCLVDSDVGTLLTGFAMIQRPILGEIVLRLSRLERSVSAGRAQVARLQDTLDVIRTMLRGFASELMNGPGLFTFWPASEKPWWQSLRDKSLGEERYEAWLWCSHPEAPHPVKQYEFKQSKEWLRTVSPYANLIVRALKLGLPIIGAAVAAYSDAAFSKAVKPRIDLMEKFANVLQEDLELQDTTSVQANGLTPAQGGGLRSLQSLLKSLDPDSGWGDLRRVTNSAGDLHWVCRHHHAEYDPGLPVLPYVSARG